MYELTQEEKLYLLEKERVGYTVVQDGICSCDSDNYIIMTPTRQFARCWCSLNKGKPIEDDVCPYCGRNIASYNEVGSKTLRTALIETWKKADNPWNKPQLSDQITLRTFFYVRKHPAKENAVQIMKIQLMAKGGKTSDDEEELVWKIVHTIDIVPGEGCRAYKISRDKEINVDMFDAFQISSALLNNAPDIQFEKSSGVIDFVLKNKKFNQYTGFMECFNLVDVVVPRNSFFMFYMYLYAQYPVVEFVVKMGYVDLIAKIMRRLAHGYNKEWIRNEAGSLTKILNCEATNGSMALTVPRYIADDLNRKEALIEEYVMWGDICQMSEDGPLSKENYFKCTRNSIYPKLSYQHRDIPNILKYGYTMQELIKYIQKQSTVISQVTYTNLVSRAFGLWKDYLNMCDILCVKPDKFPSNIETAHNNITVAFKAKQNAIADLVINKIAQAAEKCLPKNADYTNSEYVILLPHSVADVVSEGQAMHNCVGSYVNKITNKISLVFFIRKKDDPACSFVTAEYAHGRLMQIFYKNNQPVNNKTIVGIANDFCKILNTSVDFRYL